jgi:hypothetical protein
MEIGKQSWPPGPWHQEPDEKRWTDEATGLECSIWRNPDMGFLCGYVAVPEGHPLFGKHYRDVDVAVHGGPTYAEEGDGRWWIGFDCGHAFDMMPGNIAGRAAVASLYGDQYQYRDMVYVENECRRLAAQLAAVPRSWPRIRPLDRGKRGPQRKHGL